MMAEAENFLDKSTSCNASDMVPCDVVAPPEVNLLTKASRVFTLTITYFDFLFCRIHPSWKIPSHDISICSMRTFLTHGIILNSPWNTETVVHTVLSSKATALCNRLLALHHSLHSCCHNFCPLIHVTLSATCIPYVISPKPDFMIFYDLFT